MLLSICKSKNICEATGSFFQSVLRVEEEMQGFYEDFARVADDESRHFGWCVQRLQELGYAYGDMPAHDLLWEGAAAAILDPCRLVHLLSQLVL
jgi:uncharacterized ferritin-like protein (DUF455 family)